MTLTSPRRTGRLLLVLLATGIVFLVVSHRAFQRDAYVRHAVSQLRPGMQQSEVRALLKPFRADHLTTQRGQPGGTYFFRGVDEFVDVVMDGTGEDAHVSEVKRIPDNGPWWENARRNWEWRFR